MFDVLYVCSANVWRSQMAESLHERLFPDSSCRSAALIEDRRAKYADGLPDGVLSVISKNWFDASKKRPKLLTRELCDDAGRIVLLLDPEWRVSEFEINGTDAVEFLLSGYSHKLVVRPIEDPFWGDRQTMENALLAIRSVVKPR